MTRDRLSDCFQPVFNVRPSCNLVYIIILLVCFVLWCTLQMMAEGDPSNTRDTLGICVSNMYAGRITEHILMPIILRLRNINYRYMSVRLTYYESWYIRIVVRNPIVVIIDNLFLTTVLRCYDIKFEPWNASTKLYTRCLTCVLYGNQYSPLGTSPWYVPETTRTKLAYPSDIQESDNYTILYCMPCIHIILLMLQIHYGKLDVQMVLQDGGGDPLGRIVTTTNQVVMGPGQDTSYVWYLVSYCGVSHPLPSGVPKPYVLKYICTDRTSYMYYCVYMRWLICLNVLLDQVNCAKDTKYLVFYTDVVHDYTNPDYVEWIISHICTYMLWIICILLCSNEKLYINYVSDLRYVILNNTRLWCMTKTQDILLCSNEKFYINYVTDLRYVITNNTCCWCRTKTQVIYNAKIGIMLCLVLNCTITTYNELLSRNYLYQSSHTNYDNNKYVLYCVFIFVSILFQHMHDEYLVLHSVTFDVIRPPERNLRCRTTNSKTHEVLMSYISAIRTRAIASSVMRQSNLGVQDYYDGIPDDVSREEFSIDIQVELLLLWRVQTVCIWIMMYVMLCINAIVTMFCVITNTLLVTHFGILECRISMMISMYTSPEPILNLAHSIHNPIEYKLSLR